MVRSIASVQNRGWAGFSATQLGRSHPILNALALGWVMSNQHIYFK